MPSVSRLSHGSCVAEPSKRCPSTIPCRAGRFEPQAQMLRRLIGSLVPAVTEVMVVFSRPSAASQTSWPESARALAAHDCYTGMGPLISNSFIAGFSTSDHCTASGNDRPGKRYPNGLASGSRSTDGGCTGVTVALVRLPNEERGVGHNLDSPAALFLASSALQRGFVERLRHLACDPVTPLTLVPAVKTLVLLSNPEMPRARGVSQHIRL